MSVLGYILEHQEEKVLGGGGKKRGLDERDEVSFAEDNAVQEILQRMPPDAQSYIASLGPPYVQAQFLNNYLNTVLVSLPPLKQQYIKQQPTNAQKFAKLLEHFTAIDGKKKSKS